MQDVDGRRYVPMTTGAPKLRTLRSYDDAALEGRSTGPTGSSAPKLRTTTPRPADRSTSTTPVRPTDPPRQRRRR